MKNTKIFAVSTAALMLSCAAVPMLATTSGLADVGADKEYTEVGASTTALVVDAEAAKFSVSVPTSLPVYMNSEGTITTADGVIVTNGSFGAIEITDVAMNAADGWSLAVYNDFDASAFTDSTQVVAVQLNAGETVDNDGAIEYAFSQDNFASIPTGGTLDITYDVALPSFSAGLSDASVLDIVMTIGFYQDDIV